MSVRHDHYLKYTRFCLCLNSCDCAYKIGGVAFEPVLAWFWSKTDCTRTCTVSEDGRSIVFHGEGFSNGNACVRGDTPMTRGKHYFWEISIVTPMYGSSVMIGVGTKDIDLNLYQLDFVDVLGNDDDQSWGLSFRGTIRSNRQVIPAKPAATYSLGSIVGVHLDMVAGTIQFYINREPIEPIISDPAIADMVLYPMITSTAALTSMKISYAVTHTPNLSYMAARHVKLKRSEYFPQGVRKMFADYWWLLPKSTENDVVFPVQKPVENQAEIDAVEYNSGVFVVIDSEDETGMLPARMKRVLENSQNESTGLRIRVKRERHSDYTNSSS